jgi:hypothetical protein
MDPDERFLRDVHGLVRVLHHRERELHDAPLVALDQTPERVCIARLGSLDQRAIVGLAGVWRWRARTALLL